MPETSTDFAPAVIDAIADALGIDQSEVTLDATLIDELGAESIDLLDILFRIHRDTGVKIAVADVQQLLQGGIPDDEFGDEDEIVSEIGLAHLEKVLPQFDRSKLNGPLRGEQVLGLVTVRNLVDLVAQRAAEGPADAEAAEEVA
ncbi:acyl carrier protein [Nocardia sp. NBC_00511]|uniref:acyl carrier protein n=1 Tax=Nocardia sp. NBC_00511 TaxID=2903591 RepID=UPI0030E01D4A